MSEWTGAAAQPISPPEESRPYPFWNYQDLILFLGAGLPSLALSLALMIAFQRYLPGRATPLLVGQFLGYGFWFLSLYAILRLRYGKPFWSSLAWGGPKRRIAACLFLGPAVALGLAVLGSALQAPQTPAPMRELLSDRWSIAAVGLFATTFGPLCEELAFRGFLLPLLSRSFGAAAGVALSALPFALLHGPQYSWSPVHVLLVGAAGVCFGVARLTTGSTAAATGMHATYNLTFFTAFLIQEGNLLNPW